MLKRLLSLVLCAGMVAMGAMVTGCQPDTPKERMQENLEDAREDIEDAAEDVGEAVEDAGEAVVMILVSANQAFRRRRDSRSSRQAYPPALRAIARNEGSRNCIHSRRSLLSIFRVQRYG